MSRMKGIWLPEACLHLSDFKSEKGASPFRGLQECIRAGPMGRASVCRGSGELPRCGCCYGRRRLYACVTCAAVICRRHAGSHAHSIAVDVERAELFCCRCGDQVYDKDFDGAVIGAAAGAGAAGLGPPPETRRKRRKVEYRGWEEEEVIGEKSSGVGMGVGVGLGLRGLNNMGSTCFMNSVLQAMLHTPPLRNYFLSDRHNRYLCHKTTELCLPCDFDALFSAVFSGDRRPFSPANFLFTWWQHAANLATYDQQDAHEFFISMLDAIHHKLSHLPTLGSFFFSSSFLFQFAYLLSCY